MKIVLWIANEVNQKALANKIHHKFPISAIVTESRTHKRKLTLKKILEKGVEKIFLQPISRSWFGMLNYYSKSFSQYPQVPILDIENINSDEVASFTNSFHPDLIIVSGTRLIKKKLLSLSPSVGILNLHTGLSPYIKGGPNCTNWCIADKKFHLIGNTIMWIDAGIDSGNIFATEFTEFNGNESLLEIHLKVMDHAHDLYVKSIEKISEGKQVNVPQDTIAKGITYYNKQWGIKQKIKLVKNLKKFRSVIKDKSIEDQRSAIKTIDL